jgi:purine-binding chemotaxis protein CheW
MEAPSPLGRSGEFIIVEVHGQRFAVDIIQVREIRGWSISTPLAGAADDVLGIVNLRGAVLPVIDLARRLGLGETTPSPASVIIVTEIGTRLVGLLVDAVCDIYALPNSALLPAPEVGGDRVAQFVRGMFTTPDHIVTVLTLDSLAPAAIEQEAA